MPLDLHLLGSKLRRYREQLQLAAAEVAGSTGLELQVLSALEEGTREPTGDELLILSDFYRCDYKFFISNCAKGRHRHCRTKDRRRQCALSAAFHTSSSPPCHARLTLRA
jgi:transcriptional regulator with XRE-family HTH domain